MFREVKWIYFTIRKKRTKVQRSFACDLSQNTLLTKKSKETKKLASACFYLDVALFLSHPSPAVFSLYFIFHSPSIAQSASLDIESTSAPHFCISFLRPLSFSLFPSRINFFARRLATLWARRFPRHVCARAEGTEQRMFARIYACADNRWRSRERGHPWSSLPGSSSACLRICPAI